MTDNNFKIKGSDGTIVPLNDLFHDKGSSNTADKFKYWKNDDGSNYITGVNNKETYLSNATFPDGGGINGADDDGTNLGYLKSELNNWNGEKGIDSCTFTDYKGPVESDGITANYLGAYFINYTSTVQDGTTTDIPAWCDYIIIVMVGGGGGGGSNWSNDDSFSLGGGGGGGGYVISKSYNLIQNNIKKLIVIVGSGGVSYSSINVDGQNGISSEVRLVDLNGVTQAIVRGIGGSGGNVGTDTSACTGGNGAELSITNNTNTTPFTIIGSMTGIQGENGYRADDGGDSNWGGKGGKWGAESLVGCFYDSNQLNTYGPNAYGRGGKGSGISDDNDDGASTNPMDHDGGNGWVRIYFMRN